MQLNKNFKKVTSLFSKKAEVSLSPVVDSFAYAIYKISHRPAKRMDKANAFVWHDRSTYKPVSKEMSFELNDQWRKNGYQEVPGFVCLPMEETKQFLMTVLDESELNSYMEEIRAQNPEAVVIYEKVMTDGAYKTIETEKARLAL